MEHTKTPWFYGKNSREIYADGKTICRIAPGMLVGFHAPSEAEQEANAAFIVRACNAHADLVEALTRIQDILLGRDDLVMRATDAVNIARAAIAKYEGR